MSKEKTEPKKKENPNVELWSQVCDTDPSTTKKVTTRGGFTAICAQAQLKKATELWGPYGCKWGVKGLQWGVVGETGGVPLEITLDAVFYCPDGDGAFIAFEMSSDVQYKPGNDSRKKLLTDLTTKSLSKLGFNSDVFEGKFDDCKYVSQITQEFADEKKAKDINEWKTKKISTADRQKLGALVSSMNYTPEIITEYLKKVYKIESSTEIINAQYGDIQKCITDGKIEDKISEAKNANT